MANASTTATTSTAQVSAPSNVQYTTGGNTGHTFSVKPHSPTDR